MESRGAEAEELQVRQSEPRATRRTRSQRFATAQLHDRFVKLVEESQENFLSGRNDAAMQAAVSALRIRPTAHLFALLAAISESQGHFDRACDFRLLQAFLANDVVLWEELLYEFLYERQMFYRACVCLQRLSALETKDKHRYRRLQLLLADLYVGLGEVKRATNVLIPLWNSSRCRDFEVFAMLSSLFFQLGRWNALQQLISTSLEGAFRSPSARELQKQNASASLENEKGKRKRGVSKRDRFFGGDEETSGENETDVASRSVPTTDSAATADDFDFDALERDPSARRTAESAHSTGPSTVAPGSDAVTGMYTAVELKSEAAKKNFMTLVNVHAELLNELGRFDETIQLMQTASGLLEAPLLDLPPDLLVRLGVAYAYLGGATYTQPCSELFAHLIQTCSLDEYSDVLYDGAQAMKKAGMSEDALIMFRALKTHYERILSGLLLDEGDALDAQKQHSLRLKRSMRNRPSTTLTDSDVTSSLVDADLLAVEQELQLLSARISECKAVLAAAAFGAAECEVALQHADAARLLFQRVLEVDPGNTSARISYATLLYDTLQEPDAAIAVLTPREQDDAFQKILLGAELVRVFANTEKHVEAIAVGVSLFEIMLHADEGGDDQSVAPGSSASGRRSHRGNYLPTMSRASSVIVPATAVAEAIARSTSPSSLLSLSSSSQRGFSVGSAASGMGAASSIAASFRAASPSEAIGWSRRRGPLTSSMYGESAAASVAASGSTSGNSRASARSTRSKKRGTQGMDDPAGDEDAPPAKDESAIFRFNRKHRSSTTLALASAAAVRETGKSSRLKKGSGDEETDESSSPVADDEAVSGEEGEDTQTSVKRRRREITRLSPSDFWKKEPVDNWAPAEPVKEKAESESEPAQPLRDEAGFLVPAPLSRSTPKVEVKAESEMQGSSTPDETLGDGQLPSLEEISKQFSDPAMAQLFLAASSHDPSELRDAASAAAQHAQYHDENEQSDREAAETRGGEQQDNSRLHALHSSIGNQTDHSGTASTRGSPASLTQLFQLPNAGASGFVAGSGGGAPISAAQPAASSLGLPTSREVIQLLGRRRFVELAVTIIDCYSALGQFTEAREFATIVLANSARRTMFRHTGAVLDRPLRLAVLRAALAADAFEDACRVGVHLLQQGATELEREEVLVLLARVVNEGSESGWGALFRAVTDRHITDAPVLVLLANRFYRHRSYIYALNLYLAALQQRPADAFLLFHVGLCYLLTSHRKLVLSRDECLHAALYYFQQYQMTVTRLRPQRAGEAMYNVARAYHFLGLTYLAIPLYEHVSRRLKAPEEVTDAFQTAARVNLYTIYRDHATEAATQESAAPNAFQSTPAEVHAMWRIPPLAETSCPSAARSTTTPLQLREGVGCAMTLALDALRP